MEVDRLARVVWDYHRLDHALAQSDCIIVLGSHDTRVAERGAQVFLEGLAPLMVFTGNVGSLTRETWTRPEAEVFAEVAAGLGVPRDRMLLETQSTNTGENVDFTRRLLAARGLTPRSAIAVQKPYMERRTLATFQARWPELDVRVTSPRMGFDAYVAGAPEGVTRDDVIDIMVGDLQRLIVYGQRGWSAPPHVPPEVMAAFHALVAAGHDKRLVPETREAR